MSADDGRGYRSFDFTAMTADECYRLLASSIVPRPIAWTVSRSTDGILNAAPYSFFNCFGGDPPTVAIGFLPQDPIKDTPKNILDTGEFVVHLVSEELGEAMNVTCTDAPPEVDEVALAGLETVPSSQIGPPRLAAAVAAFECRMSHHIWTGPKQLLVVGTIVEAHFRADIIGEGDRPRLDTPDMHLIGRMHGRGVYARTTDLFEMDRPRWADIGASKETDR